MKFIYLFVGLLTGIALVKIAFDIPFFKGFFISKINNDAAYNILCLSKALDMSCDLLSREDVFLVEATQKHPELNYLFEVRQKEYFINLFITKSKQIVDNNMIN